MYTGTLIDCKKVMTVGLNAQDASRPGKDVCIRQEDDSDGPLYKRPLVTPKPGSRCLQRREVRPIGQNIILS